MTIWICSKCKATNYIIPSRPETKKKCSGCNHTESEYRKKEYRTVSDTYPNIPDIDQ